MTRVFRQWAILAATGVFLAAVTTTARAQDAGPIRLGLIDIYSGGVAFIAESIRTGFEIALQEANDAGGVNGRMFELTTADMGGSVEKAVTEARRMILEQDIRYVTVGIHSGAAVAVGSLAKEHKALVVGGFATSKRLTGSEGHRFVARANLSTVEIGRVMAEFIKDRPDIKSVATIAPDYEYGQHFAADFVAHLETVRPDVQVVRQEWPKFGATDFAPHVTALQARPADMVVAGVFGGDLIKFLKSAQDFGLFDGDTELFVHGLDIGKLGSMEALLPENAFGTLWYPFYALDSAKSREIEQEASQRMGTYPTGSVPIGYVAGKMISEAIIRAGGAEDVERVVDALQNVEFEGPTGAVMIRSCDGMALYDFYVGRVTRDPGLPDGVGVEDLRTYNVKSIARSCEDIAEARKKS